MTSNTQDVSITADANVDATGSEATTGTDGAVGGTSVQLIPTGIELTSELGEEFAGELVTVEVTSPSADEWGEDVYGIGTWGVGDGTSIQIGDPLLIGNANVILTSPDALSISEGIVDPAPDAMVTGIGMTITSGVGTVTAGANIGTTGVEAVVTTNAVSITADANIDATGSQITGNTGQLEYEAIYSFDGSQANITAGDAFGGEVVEVQVTTASAQPWGELAWGEGQWGQSVGTDIAIGADAVLTPSIDVPVTGEQLDWTIGNETVTGDANVTLTGNEVTTALGDEDAFTKVTVQVTGQQLTSSVSNVLAGISQLVTPTGVTATTNVGTMGINAWAVIEPNASTTWSVVDKAAA
jgi:hypothetical protein